MGADPTEVVVEFNAAVQSLGALQAAAYRLIGTGTCQIDQVEDRFLCRLNPVRNPTSRATPNSQGLREHFLDLVTDENLRERISTRTDGVRNVILALAFGSLANSQNNPS
jgi:His-Xaa-Ser system protein HxsD